MAVTSLKVAVRSWLVLAGLASVVALLMQRVVYLDPIIIRLAQTVTPPSFAEFMTRSMFEGGGFGGGDIATIAVICAFFVFLTGGGSDIGRRCGFIAGACLVLGCAVIHPLKHVTERVRPLHAAGETVDIVRKAETVASDGAQMRADRSFPSGHTATAMTLGAFVLAFTVVRSGSGAFSVRPLPFVAGTLLTTLFAVAMGAARIARGDHWPTDVLASILLGWSVLLAWMFLTERNQAGRWEGFNLAILVSIFSWIAVLIVKIAGVPFLTFGIVVALIAVFAARAGVFRNIPRPVYWMIGALTVLRLIIANQFPMTNDEAYYWDWSRSMQLSYFDHPPGVAWATWLSGKVFGGLVANGFAETAFAPRGLFPVMNIFATLALVRAFDQSARWLLSRNPSHGCEKTIRRQGMLTVAVLAQLTPIFSLVGVFALPDGGLYMFLALALAVSMPLLDSERPASVTRMAGLGLMLGLAFCFKYHAGFLGLMLLASLFLLRRTRVVSEAGSWLLLVASGLFATAPVLIWNMQNSWASIAFQTANRFASPEFNALAGSRVLAGQMLALTPVLFFGAYFALAKSRSDYGLARIKFLGAMLLLPMTVLFAGIAFYKNSLPHWTGPAFFVFIPFLALILFSRGMARPRFALSAFLLFALPVPLVATVFSFDRVENYLIARSNGNPGYLEEITLWSRMAPEVDAVLARFASDQTGTVQSCQGGIQVAGARWYAVAQLAFHMKGQPQVRSVDPDHLSFYHFRDKDFRGACPVLIVGHNRSLDREKLVQRYTFIDQGRFAVAGHDAIAVDWILAGPRQSEAWSWTF